LQEKEGFKKVPIRKKKEAMVEIRDGGEQGGVEKGERFHASGLEDRGMGPNARNVSASTSWKRQRTHSLELAEGMQPSLNAAHFRLLISRTVRKNLCCFQHFSW
jgi:hypothetical protein